MSKFDELKRHLWIMELWYTGAYDKNAGKEIYRLKDLINACLKEREETLWRDVLSRDGCGNPTYETLDEWRIGEEYL